MAAIRWEDVAEVWQGPDYRRLVLRYAESVASAPLAGAIITCVDVVDWDGNGGRDVLLSSWDACYDGRVYLRREIGIRANGTPLLGAAERIDGISGYVTVVPDGDRFHLLSTSRLRPHLLLYVNVGTVTQPAFGEPIPIQLDADWVKGNEILHLARFVDIDGDGQAELIVGTDYWDDYWPNGIEWNEPGYKPYDDAAWMGGPLRGFLYVFRNVGSISNPSFEIGTPVQVNDKPLEAYGHLAAAAGDFTGDRKLNLVWGDFLDRLHFSASNGNGEFSSTQTLKVNSGEEFTLDHCIHLPCAVDWDGDGHLDLLVGSEDGRISFVRNTGQTSNGAPIFEAPVPVWTTHPNLHAGVLPVLAAYDWRGDGLQDLIVGNSSGELLFFKNLGTTTAPDFDGAFQLEAGGEPIRVTAGPTGSIQGPSECKFGYTCPTVVDWDADGNADVLFSDIFGRHVFLKNTGETYPPSFETPRVINYNGEPLTTVWRVRPAVVDWEKDGQLSYVTLDEEGVLSKYSRRDDITLSDKKPLCWEDGTPIRFTEDAGGGLGRIKLCVIDWTGDGRYDVLVGTHGRASVPPGPCGQPSKTTGQATVLLLENVGENARPQFALPRPIMFDGEPLAMGMHACAPEALDWSGSGSLDLVVGIEDGSIVSLPRARLSW